MKKRRPYEKNIYRSFPPAKLSRDVCLRGRDVEGAAQLTLSDPDGKPRMQLKVDNAGKASITFLDSSGKVVRTIKP
jgi:hypothetical protein